MSAAEIAKKLTPARRTLLLKIVKSNGGGVSTECKPEMIRDLWNMGLIQGMAGQPWRAVHTREGLAVARSIKGKGTAS